jgi:hypothetical protein
MNMYLTNMERLWNSLNIISHPKIQFCRLGCLKFMWIDAAQICDSEKLTEWNFDISYILNPIVVFFRAMETPKNFLQLIYRFVIVFETIKRV